MAISDSQKVDLLYKKLFGVAKTDLPANKSPSNESIASPALIRGDTVWQQSDQIPATAAAVVGIVQSYQTTNRILCTDDITSVPVGSVYPSWKTNLTDWIPPEFGATYFVKVYADAPLAADPTVTGTQLSDSGIAGVGEWNFDYQAGVLNFIGGTIPAVLTAKVIYVTGYRYVGTKGLGGYSNIGNLNAATGNVSNLFAGNLSSSNVYLTGGYISGMSNISATTGNVASWYATQVNSSSANVYGPLYANSVSTANAIIGGGYISALANATITTANIGSLYATTLNSTVGNITTLVAANFSTANAIIAGGIIYNVDLQANNLSTANALITGGVLNNVDVQANNFSTANAIISSGNVTANIAGNVTGTFASFDGNVNAAWLIGNVDGTIGNFSTIVNTGNMVVGGSYINGTTAVLEEITITANTIRSNSTDLVISANTANPNNIIKFDSVSAMDIPTGTTNQRPPDPDLGYMRYNTDLDTIEFWAGTTWATTTQTISTETINPDGVNAIYTLSQVTTEAGILVNINGTVQQPGSAYTVATDQITFAETPLTTDIIEIRYLTTGIAIAPYYGGDVGGNVNIQATTSSTSSTTGALIVAGGVGIAGNLVVGGNVFQQSAYYELFGNISNTGGNLTCNFNSGTVFYVNSLTANVTANFTNVNAVTGTVTGATVIVNQGATAYQISNVQVNGAMQTVRWSGATVPTGTASNTDVMSFSLINLGAGGWRVLGQISNYG